MNSLEGKITNINSFDGLMLLQIKVGSSDIKSIIIGEPSSYSYIKENHPVHMLFKETEVIIAKDPVNISLQNQLNCTIKEIDEGKLLSKLNLDFEGVNITSIITSDSVDMLNLVSGDSVIAMIKTNEIIVTE